MNLILELAQPSCWASNEWLAAKLGCSPRMASRYVGDLKKEKRIDVLLKRYFYEEGKLKTMRIISLRTKETTFGKPMPATASVPGMKVDTSKRFPKLRRGTLETGVKTGKALPDTTASRESGPCKTAYGRATGLPRASSKPWKRGVKILHEAAERMMKTIIVDGTEREVPKNPEKLQQEEEAERLRMSSWARLKAAVEAAEERDRQEALRMEELRRDPRKLMAHNNAVNRELTRIQNVVFKPKAFIGDE